MKKRYFKPNTEVINVKLQQMIAASLPKSDTEITGAGEILSRELEDDEWNFDDNEFDF